MRLDDQIVLQAAAEYQDTRFPLGEAWSAQRAKLSVYHHYLTQRQQTRLWRYRHKLHLPDSLEPDTG